MPALAHALRRQSAQPPEQFSLMAVGPFLPPGRLQGVLERFQRGSAPVASDRHFLVGSGTVPLAGDQVDVGATFGHVDETCQAVNDRQHQE